MHRVSAGEHERRLEMEEGQGGTVMPRCSESRTAHVEMVSFTPFIFYVLPQ